MVLVTLQPVFIAFCSTRVKTLYIPRLLLVMNEYDPDCQMEFFEWLMPIYDEREYSPEPILWSLEATCKLNGTVTATKNHT
jgi:hypothetical protein